MPTTTPTWQPNEWRYIGCTTEEKYAAAFDQVAEEVLARWNVILQRHHDIPNPEIRDYAFRRLRELISTKRRHTTKGA